MIIHVSHACVKPKTVIEIIEIKHKTSEQNYRFKIAVQAIPVPLTEHQVFGRVFGSKIHCFSQE